MLFRSIYSSNRNKYIMTILLFLLFVIILQMNKCGIEPVSASPKIKNNDSQLVVWVGFEEKELKAIQAIAHQFSKTTGKKVWVIEVPFFSLKKKFQKEMKKGKAPDIFICPNDWIGEFAEKNVISPLSDKEFTGNQKKSYNPVALKALTYNKKVYGMPFFLETIAVFYNKKIVKNKPTTMDQLLKSAFAYNKPESGKYGLLFEVENFYMSMPFFSAYGVKLPINKKSKTGKIDLDTKASIKALSFLAVLKNKYHFFSKPMKSEKMRALFYEGNVAYLIDGPWVLKKFRQSMIDFDVIDFPVMKNGNRPKPFVGVHAFLLSSKCKDRKLAVKFMHYVNNTENQGIFCKIGGRIPGRTDALQSMDEYKNIVKFADISKKGIPLPNVPAMSKIWQPMKKIILGVVFEGKDPDKEIRK